MGAIQPPFLGQPPFLKIQDVPPIKGIVLYTHYFHFLIFMHFTNRITLQQSQA